MAGLEAGPVTKDRMLSALEQQSYSGGVLSANFVDEDDVYASASDEEDLEEYSAHDDSGTNESDNPEGERSQHSLSDGDSEMQQRELPSFLGDNHTVLSSYRNSRDFRHSIAQHSQAKGFEQLHAEYSAKVTAAEQLRSALASEQQHRDKLRQRAAEPGSSVDPFQLSAQEREVEEAWAKLTEAERERDLAQFALHRTGEEGARAVRMCMQESAEVAAMAHARHLGEVQRAKHAIAKGRHAREAVLQREQQAGDLQARKAQEAELHRQRAVKRLKATLAAQKEHGAKIGQGREDQITKDQQKVLKLKKSIEKTSKKIRSSNETRAKKREAQLAEREQDKRALLASGQNPYEVWRREEIGAEKERQRKAYEVKKEQRAEKLLETLLEDDRRYKKRMKEAQQKRRYDEQFQKEMGNYAKEKKVAAYIRKMTIGNVEVLDPTGTAFRIDPSKVTVQRTHAFGLGRGRPEMTRKVQEDPHVAMVRAETFAGDADLESTGGSPIRTSRSNVAAQSDTSSSSRGMQDGKLWVPKLTVLERKYMAAALERQKQNITSVQRCWGKEFKGDAFLAKPSVIAFNDFEVGKKYRQIVEVTNVSFTFNQFKLLPLDDAVKDVFQVDFVPPGRMSAGVTRYITIWFLPKENESISTTFPILAKTGRIDFPLRCTTKKTILTVTPQGPDASPVIDFGQVIRGTQSVRTLQVKNSGALSAEFAVEPTGDSEFMSMVEYKPLKGVCGAHSTATISFVYSADTVGDFSSTLRLSFPSIASGDFLYGKERRTLAEAPIVSIRGSCVSVPIQVEKDEYDLRTCVYGHTVRATIIVHNGQPGAMKVSVERPKVIDGELHMTPVVSYVQGHKDQAIQVRFSPKRDFLDRYKKFRDSTRPGQEGAFRIPMRLVGPEQALLVCTALVGTLTSNDVSFYPSRLDFGGCFVGSARVARITIVSESLLPQQFAFLRMPSILSVADVPADVLRDEEDDVASESYVLDSANPTGSELPFGVLLPKERRSIYVTYTPDSLSEMSHTLVLKVITGSLCVREFSIPCTGQAHHPIVKLSNSQVDLASIPCDTTSKESVIISNVTKSSFLMNVLVPPRHLGGLHVSPICCTLPPGERRRVQVEFRPTKAYVNALHLPPPEHVESLGHAGAAVVDPMDPEAEDQRRLHEEAARQRSEAEDAYRKAQLREIAMNGGRRWEVPPQEGCDEGSLHSYWKVPICLQPAQGGWKKDSKKPTVIHLAVRTCVLPKLMTAEPAKLDFGEVTAKQRKVLSVFLHNLVPDDEHMLMLEALPENVCFTVLNAPRIVGAKPFQLAVEFNPQRVQTYESKLVLRTQRTRLQVPLTGRGVCPVLSIEPDTGVLHLGAVVFSRDSRDFSTGKLELKNESPYRLYYQLETVIPAESSHTGVPTFTLTPHSGAIEPRGSRTVSVTFRPHRPLAMFMEKVLVSVPNQRMSTYVYLYGHCFYNQVYAIPGVVFQPFVTNMLFPLGAGPVFTDALALGVGSGASIAGEFRFRAAQPRDISLVFDHASDERVQFLLVGAGHNPGTPAGAQNAQECKCDFVIQPSEYSAHFSVDFGPGANQAKGGGRSLKPGDPPTVVNFYYKPPDNSNLSYNGVSLDLLGGIGQWVTCQVKGTLSGGFTSAGMAPQQEINVELRAYLQQL